MPTLSRLTRRQLVVGASPAPLISLPVHAAPPPQRFSRVLLGTVVDISVAGTADARDVPQQVEQAFAEMQRLERLMSRFDPESELSRINQHAGGASVAISGELMRVLQDAQRRSAATGGAFDPVLGWLTVQADPGAQRLDDAFVHRVLPYARSSALELDERRMRARLNTPLARLDLGGAAKLPILAAGLRQLHNAGVTGCLINGGGDVLASARNDGQAWRIGIRDAYQPDKVLAVLALNDGVVASSGDYERFVTLSGQRVHHIIDPTTGRPTQGLRGLTLVADRVEQVNGLGPAAMVAGPALAMTRLQHWGVTHALLMGADASVQVSPALRARLTPPPGQTQIRGLNA